MKLLSLSEYTSMKLFEEVSILTEEALLLEKLITFGNTKYGQVVFGSGGSRSGKSTMLGKFADIANFKKIDVDDMKEKLQKLLRLKDPENPIGHLDMKDPNNTGKLHQYVKERGYKDKMLTGIFSAAELASKETLPNIFFDITGKSMDDFNEVIPKLLSLGYDPKNIHLVWVVRSYNEAYAANLNAPRVVPYDVSHSGGNAVLKTHEGVAILIEKIIRTGHMPNGMNGKFVVFNNDNDVPDNEKIVTVKQPGKVIDISQDDKRKLYSWLQSYIPRTGNVGHIFSTAKRVLSK